MILRLFLLLLFSVNCCQISAAETDVIVADYLDWENYPSHYIQATPAIKDVMRIEVANYQDKTPDICTSTELMWFCQIELLLYFQSVTGNGEIMQSGFICSSNWGIPIQDTYPKHLLELAGCINIDWYSDEARYELVINDNA